MQKGLIHRKTTSKSTHYLCLENTVRYAAIMNGSFCDIIIIVTIKQFRIIQSLNLGKKIRNMKKTKKNKQTRKILHYIEWSFDILFLMSLFISIKTISEGQVSLFNGISTQGDYLMPKPSV